MSKFSSSCFSNFLIFFFILRLRTDAENILCLLHLLPFLNLYAPLRPVYTYISDMRYILYICLCRKYYTASPFIFL